MVHQHTFYSLITTYYVIFYHVWFVLLMDVACLKLVKESGSSGTTGGIILKV